MTVNHDVTGSSPVRGAKKKRPSHNGLFLFGSPCYGEDKYGFAVYCDGRSPSPFREFEPSNFAIATGRLTSEAFSESSGSRHKVAHSSRIVANYHLGTLGSICSLLCGENFGKNNSQLFLSSFPSSGSHLHRSKMQPMPKSLVLQGFFGFLGHNF